ncbi:KICSTOR complex protein kaptin-like isoform X1 [Microplitis mediator]|uniref:KICSTOR complex protein kaptin-like isoform X1 n=2 Tax=Microplitis mediator TaxID=375433 RepID=UPI00255681C3|nr:KICSTOR complex protein kaptin-like isoform X1 [Microplitis mediator]
MTEQIQSIEKKLGTMINIHWFPLTSQGNVYSMSKLCSPYGTNKILVASLKRKIFSCGYQQNNTKILRPLVKELLFTYIPSGAEIISVDAYNKHHSDEEFVIGITIIKPSNEGSIERYLNIYSESTGDGENSETSIETIAQNCLTVELTYTPYLLYHTTIQDEEIGQEVVWLISGSDNQLHMIREDKLNHGYTEFPLDKYFPELVNLQTIVLWINVYYYNNNKRRLTAVSCECGLVKVTLVDVENKKKLKEWMLRYDRPVSRIQIFSQRNNLSSQMFTKEDDVNTQPNLNILIVNALDPSIVFTDILRYGMKKEVVLQTGDNTDCILSSCVADINMDGNNEILLGTYSHEILIYIYDKSKWILMDRKKFDSPVHSMCYLDLTGDGLKELVVLTQRGVYFLQHEPKEVADLWRKRFEKLMKSSTQIMTDNK